MKSKLILCLLLYFCSSTLYGQVPAFYWGHSIGFNAMDWGYDVITDASGNVYNTGFFNNSVDFDPSPGDMTITAGGSSADCFIAKFDPDGGVVWAHNLGGTAGTGYSLNMDSNGDIIIAGTFQGKADFNFGAGEDTITASGQNDAFVAKYDQDANLIWFRTLATTATEICYSSEVDKNNNVIITGIFNSALDMDPTAGTDIKSPVGNFDTFVIKLTSTGSYVWSQTFGGTSNEVGYGVAADTFGNVFVTGRYQGTVDFDPSAGSAISTSAGSDIFLSKFDATGNHQWVNTFGGIGFDQGFRCTADDDGNVIIVGTYQSTVDFDPSASSAYFTANGVDAFLGKYDTNGDLVFAYAIQSGFSSGGEGLSVDIGPMGQILFCGSFSGTVDFNPGASVFNMTSLYYGADLFLVELDATGGFLDAVTIGHQNSGERGYATYDQDGNIFITGIIGADMDADPSPGGMHILYPYSGSAENMFLVKFGPPSILTVQLNSFEAKTINEIVVTSWKSASRDLGSNYILERSENGGLWETLHTIEGTSFGEEGHRYSFTDINPLNGLSYYRIRYTESGGLTFFSETVSVYVDHEKVGWYIKPNPVLGDEAFIKLSTFASGALTLTDLQGREIYKDEFHEAQSINLQTASFPAGVYTIRLTVNGLQQSRKLLVGP